MTTYIVYNFRFQVRVEYRDFQVCFQSAAQRKRTSTTKQATQTQPLLVTADAFAAALGPVPPEDWCRTWTTDRTIGLRRTSKRVKEVVDKMRLPVGVRLSRSFWDDTRNDTEEVKCEFVLRQLVVMTVWTTSAHSSCRTVESKDKMQRGLEECCHSVQR